MLIWWLQLLMTQAACNVGNGNRIYWQMKCVWSVITHCHPPKSWALQQLSLAGSHSEAFYSLWISVKSLSSHTALCSPPLFSTLGGHFSSNSVKERAQINSTESVFIWDMHYLSQIFHVPIPPEILGSITAPFRIFFEFQPVPVVIFRNCIVSFSLSLSLSLFFTCVCCSNSSASLLLM